MATLTSDNIVIGSGELYVQELTSSGTIPTTAADWIAIAEDSTTGAPVEGNRLSHIKNGATLSYAATYYDAKDDMNMVQKTILTEENITFKSGLMTWVPETLEKLCSTAVAVGTGATKNDTQIGGMQNKVDRKFLMVFKQASGNDFIFFVGQSKTSFDLAYQPQNEQVIDSEFSCLPELTNSDGKKYAVWIHHRV